MVASYDYLVLIGEKLDKLDKTSMFLSCGYLSEISSMDEDIGLWQFLDVDLMMHVMGV